MKNILVVFSFIFTFHSFGQDLNNYDYVVIPEKFSFLKEADQYQLNSLTKFLFEKYGFEAFLEGEEEFDKLDLDRCEGLYADVNSESGIFRTRLIVTLKDCRNRQVFVSKEGVSREKDYKTAYQEALRNAFESVKTLSYAKNGIAVNASSNVRANTESRNRRVEAQPSGNTKEIKDTGNKLESRKETSSETISHAEKSGVLNFQRDGKNYTLQSSNNGFNLFQNEMTEPFATLIRTSAGNSFIYSSITSKGVACMDNEGNLIIEILKEDGNSLETIIYKPESK